MNLILLFYFLQGTQMASALKKAGSLISNSRSVTRLKALSSVAELMNIHTNEVISFVITYSQ